MMFMKTVLIVLAFCGVVSGKRYCQQDSDCDVIGDLTCQKSLCPTWGICGCPRGQASRFVGSSLKFQCVTLKKIGESCSTDGTTGLCGPIGSLCVDGKCECSGSLVPIWDGERCSSSTLDSSNSETCSTSLGDCNHDTGSHQSDCKEANENWWTATPAIRSPFDGVPNTCACPEGTHTKIPNDYDKSPFVGRRTPECVPIIIDEPCLRNEDCSEIKDQEAECVDSVCKCKSGSPYDTATGMSCGTVKVLNDKCLDLTTPANNGPCARNMVCGDVCDIDNYLTKDRICKCAPGYNPVGTSCVAIESGSSCNGDAMCRGLGYDALCLDGVCRAGASPAVLSFTILLLAFAAHIVT